MHSKRALLHKNHLDEFISWLDIKGISHRPGKGAYQVLQVLTRDGWSVVFSRNNMPEHYSLNESLVPTVKDFIRARRSR